jgi:hypothetical protein
MIQPRTGLPVLARFPDVGDETKPKPMGDGEAQRWDFLGSSGRWIGQAMSVKLLAGITLFLLVGAVLPIFLSQKSPPANLVSDDGTLATGQRQQADSPTQTPSDLTDTPAATVACRPPVRVPPVSASDRSLPPASVPRSEGNQRPQSVPPTVAESLMSRRLPAESKQTTSVVPTVAESPMSSPWSPPSGSDVQRSTPGTETTASNANRGTENRPTEYEADARGRRPGEPGARFEGTIEGTKR